MTIPSKARASSLWLPHSDGSDLLTFTGKLIGYSSRDTVYIRIFSQIKG